MDNTKKNDIEDQLTLEYHGVPVESGRMNSYEVAAYIMAFSDFLGIISRTAYGEKIELQTKIQGFSGGSFKIDFALYVGILAATIFDQASSLSVKEFIGLIKESIGVWSHLRGEPPKAISPDPGTKNNFQIENQNGQSIYASGNVVNIITNMEAGEAVEKFIKSALEKDLSHVQINSKSVGEVAKIEKKEAAYFIPIITKKPPEVKNEQEIKISLLIESAVFKEGNKWRFSDGENSFPATIADEEFIKKVNEGSERFGKGDELVAKVLFTQSGTFGSLKLDRTIVKVLEHKIPPRTGRLFRFDSSEK
jgi:hypothetical protein